MKINSLFLSLVSTTPIEQNAKEKLSRQKRFSSLPNFADLTLADIAECINRNQKYCLRMTSSRDEALCQHAVAGAGPKDWTGGDIAIKHNSKTVAIVPSGFEDFEYCFNGVDVSNDRIQLQSSNSDGVCITSLSINDKKLFLGKHNEQQSFWIDRQIDEQFCLDDFMSTSEITIQNGQVISSTCKKDDFFSSHGYIKTTQSFGTVFYKVYGKMDWYAAKSTCEGDGAMLPVPRSDEENEFIANLLPKKHIWLGINDIDNEGIFTDHYGEPVTYFNWRVGEPNSYQGSDEDVVHITNEDAHWHNDLNRWNDIEAKASHIHAVCIYINPAESDGKYSYGGVIFLRNKFFKCLIGCEKHAYF